MSRAPAEIRFDFGENWIRFLEVVDDERLHRSADELRAMLGVDSLAGKTFLDAGCGSGLSSLAAVRLGAELVRSFDYDEESIAATRTLKQRFEPAAGWSVEHGDATDAEYMKSLGTFDVVYSWGVLHHTGAMWKALEHTCARVAPGGTLFVSIYNDQGRQSGRWRVIKHAYNRLPSVLRVPYAVAVMLPLEARMLVSATVRGRPGDYLRGWTEPRERGMSRWHDLLDWVGGYPFEVAKPEEVFRFCRERGFELVELTTAGGSLGCNQFVLQRSADRPGERDQRRRPTPTT